MNMAENRGIVLPITGRSTAPDIVSSMVQGYLAAIGERGAVADEADCVPESVVSSAARGPLKAQTIDRSADLGQLERSELAYRGRRSGGTRLLVYLLESSSRYLGPSGDAPFGVTAYSLRVFLGLLVVDALVA